MTAKDAKKITEANKKPIEETLNTIEQQAKFGLSQVILFDLDLDKIGRLIELGYKLEQGNDPMGFAVHRCSW